MIWLLPIVAMLVAAVLVLSVWPRTGPWGINLSKVCCPRCGLRVPRWRKPANERQALWGGWTCKQCGCEIDKYGAEIQEDAEPQRAGRGAGEPDPKP